MGKRMIDQYGRVDTLVEAARSVRESETVIAMREGYMAVNRSEVRIARSAFRRLCNALRPFERG